jgi:hypothetical protein
MRNNALLILSLFVLQSCVISIPGFYCGYKKLTPREQEEVIILNPDDKIAETQSRGKILAITGNQLQAHISNKDSVLMYVWSPHCKSDNCILLSAFNTYCNSKQYNLVVLAEYYDMEQMNGQNGGMFPIFIPNHIFYKRYYANTLNKRFMKDLIPDDDSVYDLLNGRYLLFSKGQLIEQKHKLPI